MRTLAALQHLPASKLDLKDLPLDVERATAGPAEAGVAGRGPRPVAGEPAQSRHSDAEMVKALGRHHDPIVSQYSVWAITESERLQLVHLGLNLKDIERYPDNIRGWLFQLLAIEATDAEPHWEYVSLGMGDPAAEARKGLAVGLRNTFIDVFEPWFWNGLRPSPIPTSVSTSWITSCAKLSAAQSTSDTPSTSLTVSGGIGIAPEHGS